MKKKILLLGLALLIISFGGLIYLCFRPPTILLFRWLDLAGFNYSLFQKTSVNPPSFFVYNLPNVLFVLFAYVILYIIWDNRKYHYLFYFSLVTILAMVYEIVTKDIGDLVAILLTSIICSIFYIKKTRSKI
jgi:hypothetical protein